MRCADGTPRSPAHRPREKGERKRGKQSERLDCRRTLFFSSSLLPSRSLHRVYYIIFDFWVLINVARVRVGGVRAGMVPNRGMCRPLILHRPSCVTVGGRSSGTRRGTGARATATGFVCGQENEHDFRLGDLAAGVC